MEARVIYSVELAVVIARRLAVLTSRVSLRTTASNLPLPATATLSSVSMGTTTHIEWVHSRRSVYVVVGFACLYHHCLDHSCLGILEIPSEVGRHSMGHISAHFGFRMAFHSFRGA